jgi:mono/diheme cytochrome c family protein
MTTHDRTFVLLVAVAAAGIFSAALRAQAPRTVWDGVYSEPQAARGAAIFDKDCAGCHGPSGEGGGLAPALMGAAFAANYDGLTVGDLFTRNRATMPPGKEGQMSAPQTADITAAILQFNRFPAGEAELPNQGAMLKAIQYVATKP